MKAGFAQTDITPPVGTLRIGWIKEIVSESVLDPLYVRCAAFEHDGARVGFVQLDTLSVRWTMAEAVRKGIEERTGFPIGHIMVSATHNHAGPAVAGCGMVSRDDGYVAGLIEKCVHTFREAVDGMCEAELALGHAFEMDVARNRRVVMRDGTVRTHGSFKDPDCLYVEGPIDPEVAVLAAREAGGGAMLGCMVNFACHPTHHGGETVLSAGFPGVVARTLEEEHGVPVSVYLNGAGGNISTSDPAGARAMDMETTGKTLAADAWEAIEGAEFSSNWPLSAVRNSIDLPYREATRDQIEGTALGAQRFIDPTLYDKTMPRLLERIETRGTQLAEVQAIRIGHTAWVSIPAEYFVEHGLRIKEKTWPTHTLVVSHANGMVGYIPTRQAFERGGYETTFANSSRMAPEAGDLLADEAIRLVRAGARCDA